MGYTKRSPDQNKQKNKLTWAVGTFCLKTWIPDTLVLAFIPNPKICNGSFSFTVPRFTVPITTVPLPVGIVG